MLVVFEERLNFIILNVTCNASETRDNTRQTISFILLHLAKGISFRSNFSTCSSFLHFSPSLFTVNLVIILRFQSSKNLKLKAHSSCYNESTQLKGSVSQACPKVFQELLKIHKFARRSSSMIIYIFNKLLDV